MLYYIVAHYANGKIKAKHIRQRNVLPDVTSNLIHWSFGNRLYVESDCQHVCFPLVQLKYVSIYYCQKDNEITFVNERHIVDGWLK